MLADAGRVVEGPERLDRVSMVNIPCVAQSNCVNCGFALGLIITPAGDLHLDPCDQACLVSGFGFNGLVKYCESRQ